METGTGAATTPRIHALKPSLVEWKLIVVVPAQSQGATLETFLSGMETRIRGESDRPVGVLETFLSGMETLGRGRHEHRGNVP